MKPVIRICILLVCVMLSMPAQMAHVYAQAGPENFPLFEGDRIIRGENAREETYFEIGKGRMAAAGSFLDLYYGHSPTLLPKVSSLTLLLDDLPIGSVGLDDSNKEPTLWRVDLTKYGLKAGFHKLTLQTHLQLADNVCVDPQNAANWVAVHKNSRFNLNLVPSYEQADLTTYPSPFFEKGSISPLQSIIAVPDNMEQNELAPVSQLAQFFASLAPDKRINFTVYTESELTDSVLRDNRIIWFGRSDHWKERGLAAVQAVRKLTGAPANQWQGFIGVAPSPWNGSNPQLVVTGTAEEIANGAAILTDEILYSQLQGAISLLPAELKKKEAAAESKLGTPYTVSLEKMGYNNLTIEGAEQGSVRINYPIPGNWDIDNGAGLKLLFKHSKTVDLKQSVISVKLNGVPVQSTRLTEATADSGVLELILEPSVIGTRRTLEIDVSFQFVNTASTAADAQTQKLQTCITPNNLGNWAVIDKASTLTYIPAERQTLRLESLPYPFVMNGRWNQTALLLPEPASTNELSMALTLAGIIGKSAKNNNELTLFKTTSANLKDQLKDYNIIYIGPSKSLPDFMNGFTGSLVQFKDDKLISISDDVQLLSELQSNSSAVQLSRSPLNATKGLLLMAATSPDRQGSINSAFTSPAESSKITGKLVVIDNKNKVHAFPLPDEPLPLKSEKPDAGIFFNTGGNISQLIFIIVFLLVLLAIIAINWFNRKRR